MSRLTPEQQRWLAAGVTAVIVLLLLLNWKRGNNVNNQVYNQAPVNFTVAPTYLDYNTPPITNPNSPAWDWMQSTDCSCDCDEDTWRTPLTYDQIETITYPVVQYVSQPEYLTGPDLGLKFPVYQAPPLPSWWYDTLVDVYGKPRTIIRASDGNLFRYLGDKQTFAQNTHRVEDYTVSGNNLYYAGNRYIHDASKDNFAPVLPDLGAVGGF